MKLGGWQRLFIFVATLYLIVVAIFAAFNYPKVETTHHRTEFYERMSKESVAILANAHNNRDIVRAKMPNNHVISFATSTPQEQMEKISREYYKIVTEHVDRERWLFFGIAFLVWWMLPLILLYVVGVAVGWVYRGFRVSE